MAAAMFMGEPRRSEPVQFVRAPDSSEPFTPGPAGGGSPEDRPATPADVVDAAHRGRAAQHAWGAMPPYFRLAALRRLPDLLDSHRGMVASVLRNEAGLASAVAYERVFELAAACQRVTSTGLKTLRPVKRRQLLRVTAIEHRDPLGLIGILPSRVSGFDPVMTAAALLAGNALLFVPEGGAGCYGARLLAQFCTAARLPDDLVQVAAGPAGLADALIGHADHLVTTLATDRGQQLWQLAKEQGVGVTVEGTVDPAGFTALRTQD